MNQPQHPQLSRRDLLRLLSGAAGAAALAACGTTTPTAAPAPSVAGSNSTAPSAAGSTAPSSAASTAPSASASARPAGTTAATGSPTSSAAGTAVRATPSTAANIPTEIQIVNSGAKLPTEKVSFRWVDSGDQKAVFFKQYFQKYQQVHSNITIDYNPLPWNEIGKVIPLGVQNGNAPDVFQVPQNVPGPQAVREGWVAPLDDLIPNFAEWKKGFPPGAFVTGITDFNGKTYTIPLTSNQRYGQLTLYNQEYLQQAGYDPSAKPFTWTEFRAALKKLTEQGKGKYFGLIFEGNQTARFAAVVNSLAQMAGAGGTGGTGVADNINWKTGQYNYLSDQYLGAIDLLLGIKSDNSVFPGSLSLNAPQARAQFPNGVAAIILQGPWNIPQWQLENPTFKFGVASQPIPDNGNPLPLGYGPGGSNLLWIYAKSPNKAVAADILSYLGSLQGQVAWGSISDGADSPIFPQANQYAKVSPLAKQAQDLFEKQMRLAPDPNVRNPDVASVSLEFRALNPDFGQVVQGLFSGQLKDPKAAMKDLQDRSEAELDRAIKAAQAKGAKVSRDDWKFANWDPTKNYTEADYKGA